MKKAHGLLRRNRRGRLPPEDERKQFIIWLNEAVASGKRLTSACREVNLSLRTLRRWQCSSRDRRPDAMRPVPLNQLSTVEEKRIRDVCHEPEYASLPPPQIVSRLADKDLYLASESTFYRILHRSGEVPRRGRQVRQQKVPAPTTFTASGPSQVWSWGITWLPSVVRGRWHYLYMILDVYCRKITGYEVYETESGEQTSALMQGSVIREGCWPSASGPAC